MLPYHSLTPNTTRSSASHPLLAILIDAVMETIVLSTVIPAPEGNDRQKSSPPMCSVLPAPLSSPFSSAM